MMAQPKVAQALFLSLTTGPLLLAVLTSRTLASLMQEIGQASEEIFRGDRLPVLNVPPTSVPEETDHVPS